MHRTLKQKIKSSRILSRVVWLAYRELLVFRSHHPKRGPVPRFQENLRMEPLRLRSISAYNAWLQLHNEEAKRRVEIERSLIPANASTFSIPGTCALCSTPTQFRVDFDYGSVDSEGRLVPNFRESLVCSHCGLKNRVRGLLHAFIEQCMPAKDAAIYITEQLGGGYGWLRGRYSNISGSEYRLYPGPSGSSVRGIRNEDLGALTWPNASFNFVLSLDVLEHVPNIAACFAEIFRCLKPGGRLLFTAPFVLGYERTLTRATLDSQGGIVHREEPEYHGGNLADPGKGTLCFRHFGWDVTEELQKVGFLDGEVWLYWSKELGYLGDWQSVLTARKP
jgi:hypothetical protein